MKRRRRRKRSKGGESVGVGMKKRKQLSEEQAKLLEQHFGKEHKLESERKDRLACELGLNPRQVAVWFQNRRARWKNQKLEQAYTDLKNLHETTLLEKCRLQTEVSKLKEELWEAEKEIQRLIESGKRVVSNEPKSPSCSWESMVSVEPPFLGEFGYDDDIDDVFVYTTDHYISQRHKLDLDSDSEIKSKLIQILSYQLTFHGVFLRHKRGDSKERRVELTRLRLLGDLLHQRGVLNSQTDLEIDDVHEGRSMEGLEECLVGGEDGEHRDG
ncbi:homeobox-leucine zipper protein ATHB-40 [Senna tora]|uniref:Homeobox-leucine zipper protein n=1 Tax=Senna tora TaxID=362788 RepID=A0A834SV47_9FABA|nr:homeobox-leucine zipper protein ATHB-40 [Senna tora]